MARKATQLQFDTSNVLSTQHGVRLAPNSWSCTITAHVSHGQPRLPLGFGLPLDGPRCASGVVTFLGLEHDFQPRAECNTLFFPQVHEKVAARTAPILERNFVMSQHITPKPAPTDSPFSSNMFEPNTDAEGNQNQPVKSQVCDSQKSQPK